MKLLTKTFAAALLSLLCFTGASQAQVDETPEFYRAQELSIDAFGTGSVGQQTIDNISGNRVSSDVRLGLGLGVNYFFTRYLGVGGDLYSESLSGSFIDSTSVNFIARIPIGNSGLAPYGFAGGGRQWDRIEQWFVNIGAGVEVRFHRNWGIFIDARYVLADKSENYGVGRAGVRFSF